jgi:hypothetical protein
VVERERQFDRGARESLPPSERPLSEEMVFLDGDGGLAEDRALAAAALVSDLGVGTFLADSLTDVRVNGDCASLVL